MCFRGVLSCVSKLLVRKIQATICLAIAAFATPALAVSSPLMAVPGLFDVSSTGGASYSVPITLPPGTAGVVPQLSLGYSSQSGDGYVGWGWGLSGLPSITRCPRTLAQDSVHGAVTYSSTDRFCLNGQRLVAISGTYGSDGTVYRTEIDNFWKVVSYGTAGNGPSYFKVWTKNGQVMEFGNTTDSKILAVGSSTARVWALDKATDTKGNYYSVTYVNDTTYGQYYPSRIDYTGNSNTGLATYNSVQFSYTTRIDTAPTYQAGSLQQTTVLLSHVKTYQGSSLVLDYQLGYRAGTTTAHSRLTSITQCNASGSCLAPTTFGWQGGTGTLNATSQTNTSITSQSLTSQVAYGDINGDGLTDVISSTADVTCIAAYKNAYISVPITVLLGSNSGTYTSQSITASYGGTQPGSGPYCGNGPTYRYVVALMDYNGDGVSDFILGQHFTSLGTAYMVGTVSGMYYYNMHNSNLSAFSEVSANNVSYFNYGNPPTTNVIDINGDGLEEYPGYVSNGDGTFTASSTISSSGYPGDFNGDGCTDMLVQASATHEIEYSCNPSVSKTTVTYWSGATIVVGDFNGDGMDDVLEIPTSGNGTLYLSTGTSLVATSFTVPSSWDSGYKILAGDFNHDGKDDIVLIKSGTTGGTHDVYLSTGAGFTLAASLTNSAKGTYPHVADLNNDGVPDITADSTIYTFDTVPELMTTVSNGIGGTTTISYDRLNRNGTFYTKGSDASYPTKDYDAAMYVVSGVAVSNGIGGTRSSTYAYSGAKRDLKGRGFLGFSTITSTDVQTGIVTKTTYHTDFPFLGQVSSRVSTVNGVTLSSTVNTFADTSEGTGTEGATYYFVYLSQMVSSGTDLNGTALPTTTVSYTYDSYGNVLTQAISVSDGSSSTTTNTYTNDTTNWILGQLATAAVANTVGSSSVTRHQSFTHDSSSGLVTQSVVESGDTSHQLTTSYTYDSYGNVTATTVSGSGVSSRTTTNSFDGYGRFMTGACNGASECHGYSYDAASGGVSGDTDPNGLTTSVTYDGFGRPALVTKPDGTKVSTSYAYCSGVNSGSASCPTYGAFAAISVPQNSSSSQNSASTTAYYDALNRPIAADTQGFGGASIRQAKSYDAYGRVSATSRPYFVSGGSAKNTTYSYDLLGRVVSAVEPSGATTTYSYSGLTTTVTNAKSQVTTTVKNAQNQVASVTDALSHTTSYTYDAFGNLAKVVDPSGNIVSNSYDVRGNKTASSDPDMGSWAYSYNVYGELTSQTDAKGQTTTLSYDLAGRPTARSESGLYSTWSYGNSSSGHNVGVPTEMKACTASDCGTITADRTFSYDGYGRPVTSNLTTGGTTYTYTLGYDSNGQLSSVSYPSGFVAAYTYDSYGYMTKIADGSSGAAYWTANGRDAELHLLSQAFGNGVTQTDTFDANTGLISNIRAGSSNSVAQFDYTFDLLGNLTYRTDNYNGLFEYACYDSLNRLTNYTAGASVTSCTSSGAKTVAYDAVGNITSKSDVGTYSYPSAGSARPHAVTSITGTVNGVVNPSYSYDANGNMISGGGRTVNYTGFNMAATIAQGTTSAALVYDSLHSRVQQTLTVGSTATVTTYLNDPASGTMSEKSVVSGTTTWHDYVVADGKIVAEKFSGGTSAVRYFVSDHISSVAVVMDESGSVVERNAYDAWGKRRVAGTWADDAACSLSSVTSRGFTGHEEIDAACLINANARIYDPLIGRFMSPDTIIAQPYDGQNFNRYTYVDNNPHTFTDPTGHDKCDSPVPGCVSVSIGAGLSAEAVNKMNSAIYLGNLGAVRDLGTGLGLLNTASETGYLSEGQLQQLSSISTAYFGGATATNGYVSEPLSVVASTHAEVYNNYLMYSNATVVVGDHTGTFASNGNELAYGTVEYWGASNYASIMNASGVLQNMLTVQDVLTSAFIAVVARNNKDVRNVIGGVDKTLGRIAIGFDVATNGYRAMKEIMSGTDASLSLYQAAGRVSVDVGAGLGAAWVVDVAGGAALANPVGLAVVGVLAVGLAGYELNESGVGDKVGNSIGQLLYEGQNALIRK